MAKRYEPLGAYLQALPLSQREVTLDFIEIERIVGDALPPSAFQYREFWANQEGGSRAPHWQSAGFRVGSADLANRRITFSREAQAIGIMLNNPNLHEVVKAVNRHAQNRAIGGLQEERKRLKGLSRVPSRTIFQSDAGKKDDFAHHTGGLLELQFNLALEEVNKEIQIRHGVAFSLQSNRELPDISVFIPKFRRFNEYLTLYPEAFAGLNMWHYEDGYRGGDYAVSPIPDRHLEWGRFIFLGSRQSLATVNLDRILDDFDAFLPLYRYVEGSASFPTTERLKGEFVWTPGNRARVTHTQYDRAKRTVDRMLRHNAIQHALFEYLRGIHGDDNVSGEQNAGNGTSVDVAVKDGEKYVYYEIKTGLSARSCIREAMGQLLEYSFWPGNQTAASLIIVGEAEFDIEARSFISHLRNVFSLPVKYRRFDMDRKEIVTS